MPEQNWRLAPSDLTFLWHDCPRCFYVKVREGVRHPTMIPAIFSQIDSCMKAALLGTRTEAVSPDAPTGVFELADQDVESSPIRLPGRPSTCFIRGKLDSLVKFDDGTYGVVDFKTAGQKLDELSLYALQLHAYAYALEHPAPDRSAVGPVSELALLVFEPEVFEPQDKQLGTLRGPLKWIDIPRHDGAFLDFLAEVLYVLEQSSRPEGTPSCEWCRYRERSRQATL